MAYLDLRAPHNPLAEQKRTAEEEMQATIDRIFFEVAVEAGLAEAEYPMPGMTQPDEPTVLVYDKFTPTGQ